MRRLKRPNYEGGGVMDETVFLFTPVSLEKYLESKIFLSVPTSLMAIANRQPRRLELVGRDYLLVNWNQSQTINPDI